jgi:pyruvate dehydrogenase E1 component beta subunit
LSTKGPVDIGGPVPPLTGPKMLREGRDATIVASLAMVGRSLEAAELLAKEGIEAEVFDIRSLRPMITGPVVESVKKTNILVGVEEQAQVGGWTAEVAAQVTAEAFDYLDAPPARVTLPDYPVPYSPPLEDSVIPSPERIAATVKSLL